MLAFLSARAIPGVERVAGGVYERAVKLGSLAGRVSVAGAGANRLVADVSVSLAPKLMLIVSRLRALFDLDARPDAIAEHLGADRVLRKSVGKRPGLRVPGAFDPFETAVRAILGQQVSVRAATTLAGRIVRAFGASVETGIEALDRVFPTAEALAEKSEEEIASIGMPKTRAKTIVALANAVAEARIDLSDGSDPEQTTAHLMELPGVGEWTAQYIAMRALRWSNAFPAGDLGVLRALGVNNAREAKARAHRWEPWRAYAVMHLWSGIEIGG
jgi:AraC family transcriptional regulator of adaptative response / DNA-3-methyladenine glycosylase II